MHTPIAIVSMACRLPGAVTVQDFWPRILEGRSEPIDIPADRWNAHQFYHPKPATVGKCATVQGFFLDHVRDFDADFFKLSGPDVAVMDPQQRLLLELAYETLLSTGRSPEFFRGSQMAVYLGITKSDYQDHVQQALIAQKLTQKTVVVGVLENLIAARIANYFDLRGPALTLDTACSSALVALHMACESLRAGSVEMALVGGVNLNLTPGPFLGMSAAGALSPEAAYYVFDARARGFFMGEGGGLVLLKSLDRARADGDAVLGVILGSALNNDGKSISPMAPRSATQQDVVWTALKQAGIGPEAIDLIEAHGTGTPLGDAVEAQSLRSVFKESQQKPVLSTVKPNVGHLLSAAGMPSLIKVLLAFQHRKMPPLANYAQARPELKLEQNGFIFNSEPLDFPERLVTAGINAFGFGGTNAHIILQEPPLELKSTGFQQLQPDYKKKEYWIELSHVPQSKSVVPPVEVVLPEAWKPEWEPAPLQRSAQRSLPAKIWSLSTPFQDAFAISLQNKLQEQNTHLQICASLAQLSEELRHEAQQTGCPQEVILLHPASHTQLLKQMQMLAKLEPGLCARLWIITQHTVRPETWLRDGLAFAAISELQPIRVHWMQWQDMTPVEGLASMIAELQAPDQDVQVLYTQSQRQLRCFRPQIWPTQAVTYRPGPENSYIISGGAQGLGAEVARALGRAGAGKLILIGRRPVSELKAWPELQAELSAYGARASYYAVDVTEAEEVQQLLEFLSKTGPVTGIVHAAGLASAGRFAQLEAAALEAVLAPKVQGLKNILKSVRGLGLKLDFICLFSSLSSLVPGFARGVGAYATANAFLDASVTAYPDLPLRVINWGPWSETGMAAQPALLQQLEQRGIIPLKTASALAALLQILAVNSKHLLLVNTESGAKTLTYQLPEAAVLEIAPASPVLVETEKNTAPTLSFEALTTHLKFMIEQVLKEQGVSADVSLHDNLLDLGLDSLSALELTEKLGHLGYEDLPFELLFEQQSIYELATYLEGSASLNPSSALPVTSQKLEWSLSPVQQAFYLAHHVTGTPNFSAFRVTLNSALDPQVLSESLSLVFQKHPLLRACFWHKKTGATASQTWVQEIRPLSDLPALEPELLGLNHNQSLKDIEQAFVNRPFDLEEDLLLRLGFIQNKEQSILLIVAHHIIFDAYSMQTFLQDLLSFYFQCQQNLNPKIDEDQRYLTYLKHLQGVPLSDKYHQAVQDWKDYFAASSSSSSSVHAPLWLSQRLKQRQDLPELSSEVYYGKVPEDIAQKLKDQSRQVGLPLQSLYLAAYYRALSRWTGLSEIWVHLAVSGRSWPIDGLHQTVGCFAETYPLYWQDPLKSSPLDLAQALRQHWNQSKKRQFVGAETVRHLLQEQGLETGFFAFSFAHFDPAWARQYQNLGISDTQVRGFQSGTGLALLIAENLHGFCYSLNMPVGLFQPAEIDAFQALLQDCLKQISEADRITLESKDAVDSPASETIGGILANHSTEISLYACMLHQIEHNPEQIVCTYQGQDYRAADFLAQSRQIAQGLLSLGLEPGALVALLGIPGPETSMALLALLQLGCSWLPLDPATPLERLQGHLTQAVPQALLLGTSSAVMDAHSKSDFSELSEALPHCPFVSVSELLAGKHSAGMDFPEQIPRPEQTAYIIFTSGSTGQSQGVLISYAALQHYLNWCQNCFDYGPWDRIIQTASIAFDAAVRQLLMPLLVGACACPVPPEIKQDARALFEFVRTEQITVWSSVPALWHQFLLAAEIASECHLPALRLVKVGGEVLPIDWVRRWQLLYGVRPEIVNLYGPTETTINASFYRIQAPVGSEDKDLPIGQLLPGYKALIMSFDKDAQDSDAQPVASGASGELWLAGPGLSSGYLANPELNQQRFKSVAGQRYYRTGDRVSQAQGGQLYYQGRIDRQIKLRGYRLEPAEIEGVLCQDTQVEQAAVFLVAGQLLACVVLSSKGHPVNFNADVKPRLIRACKTQLPDWMLPHKLFAYPDFPRLPNGKIDWEALQTKALHSLSEENTVVTVVTVALCQDPEGNMPRRQYIQDTVALIWQDLLRLPSPPQSGDFFMLGGDSLRLMELFLKLEHDFEVLPRIADFYRSRQLHWLVEHILVLNPDAKADAALPTTPMASVPSSPDRFPLSPTQMGFYVMFRYFKQQREAWLGHFVLKGKAEPAVLQEALMLLAQRHQMLQVQLKAEAPAYFERVKTPAIAFTYLDLCTESPETRHAALNEKVLHIQAEKVEPLDYPLLRLHLLSMDPEEHHCLIQAHHILADGLSTQILMRELLQLYALLSRNQAPDLKPLRSQFSDYIALLDKRSETQQADQLYWQRVFRPDYSAPQLRQLQPSGKPHFKELRQALPLARWKQLKEQAAQEGVTPFILLWQAYYLALVTLSGQSDLLIGTAHHGRDYPLPDIQHIFGCFARALPLRLRQRGSLQELQACYQECLSHELDPAALLRLLPPGTGLAKILGSQFFLTILEPVSPQTIQPGQSSDHDLSVDWSRSASLFHPAAEDTDLFLVIKITADHVAFQLLYHSEVLTEAGAHKLMQDVLLCLEGKQNGGPSSLLARAGRSDTELHFNRQALQPTGLKAALIGYLPSIKQLQALHLPLSPEALKQKIFAGKSAIWLDHLHTELGSTGFLALPYYAEEILPGHASEIEAQIEQALKIAQEAGARVVSLAGMLPAVTAYGQRLNRSADQAQLALRVTTGHSATVAAVVSNSLALWRQAGVRVSDETLAMIGLGSIGEASLELLLQVLEPANHPRRLWLCDRLGSEERLHNLAQNLRLNTAYVGEIVTSMTRTQLPRKMYQARLMIAAVSSARVLEIDLLEPGTLLVDDSFPHCFDVAAAQARMQKQQDVLIAGGGLMGVPCPSREIYLPIDHPGIKAALNNSFLPHSLPGCQLESLLLAVRSDLPQTLGLVQASQAHQYLKVIAELGLSTVSPHLEGFVFSEALIESVKTTGI